MELHTCIAQAAEQSKHVILITDVEGNIIYANPAITDLSGYTPVELAGQNVRIFRSGRHAQDFYDQLWETILRGEIWSGTVINKRKDGTLYHEHMTIIPLKDESGTITQFTASKRNIDPEIAAQRELTGLRLRVQRDASTHLYLLKDISHKIRTTMNSIMGFTGLLSAELDQEKQEFLSVIVNNGNLLLANFDDILLMARLQSGDLPLTKERFKLDAGLTRIAAECTKQMRDKNARIQTYFYDEVSEVLADRSRFVQVLTDVLENAIKRSRAGSVAIETQLEGESIIRIIIGDSGAWMHNHLRKEIMAEFDYIEQDNWQVFEESGINTIVTKGLIELMGGSISFLVSMDAGNLFVLRFNREMI